MAEFKSTTHPSRRAIFAGIPAAAALVTVGALPALAAEDPIFAAIERHKAAKAMYSDCCTLTDSVAVKASVPPRKITRSDHRAFRKAETAAQAAGDELMALVPTTVASLRAFLLYVRKIDWDGDDLDCAVDVVLRSPVLAV